MFQYSMILSVSRIWTEKRYIPISFEFRSILSFAPDPSFHPSFCPSFHPCFRLRLSEFVRVFVQSFTRVFPLKFSPKFSPKFLSEFPSELFVRVSSEFCIPEFFVLSFLSVLLVFRPNFSELDLFFHPRYTLHTSVE